MCAFFVCTLERLWNMLYKHFIFISVAIRMAYRVAYDTYMFLKTETSMIAGWFTVVYAIFRFSQENLELSGWLFISIFKIKKIFFKSLTQSFCILKEHNELSLDPHSKLMSLIYQELLKFSFGGLSFLSRWRKAASIKVTQKFHFQCSFLSQEYQEVYSGSLLFPYNCPILTTCIPSWTRAMVIVNWTTFFNLGLAASHF